MSSPNEHKAYQFAELNKINDALNQLRGLGFGPLDEAYQALYSARGAALGKLGLTQPRTSTFLKLLIGLSPGELRLYQDAELGWLVEVVESPGAAPVRKYVSDEVAGKILTGELDHDGFMQLAAPEEPYIA